MALLARVRAVAALLKRGLSDAIRPSHCVRTAGSSIAIASPQCRARARALHHSGGPSQRIVGFARGPQEWNAASARARVQVRAQWWEIVVGLLAASAALVGSLLQKPVHVLWFG